jgi:hypothetical protein
MNTRSLLLTLSLLAGLALVGSACGADSPDTVTAEVPATPNPSPTPSTPTPPDVSAAPGPDENAAPATSPVTLYISNQSFDDPSVTMTVTIDGTVVADQEFNVEGQHNWITFDLDLPAGDHSLVAVSDTATELTAEFSTALDQPRWAVIDYWWYSAEGAANFTFDISDKPIGFA